MYVYLYVYVKPCDTEVFTYCTSERIRVSADILTCQCFFILEYLYSNYFVMGINKLRNEMHTHMIALGLTIRCGSLKQL